MRNVCLAAGSDPPNPIEAHCIAPRRAGPCLGQSGDRSSGRSVIHISREPAGRFTFRRRGRSGRQAWPEPCPWPRRPRRFGRGATRASGPGGVISDGALLQYVWRKRCEDWGVAGLKCPPALAVGEIAVLMPTRLGRTLLGESFFDKKTRTEESPAWRTARLEGEIRGKPARWVKIDNSF